jgi:hypothetical protein
LKKEEACDVAGREVASEKEFQSTLQISASWEDLSLVLYVLLMVVSN